MASRATYEFPISCIHLNCAFFSGVSLAWIPNAEGPIEYGWRSVTLSTSTRTRSEITLSAGLSSFALAAA